MNFNEEQGSQADSSPGLTRDPHFVKALEALGALRTIRNKRLREVIEALEGGNSEVAERLVTKFLDKHPEDADALNLAAEIARRSNRLQEADRLLAKCVERAPQLAAYRFNYAVNLSNISKHHEAIAQLNMLLEKDPGNILYQDLKAQTLRKSKDYFEAKECYRRLTEQYPDSSEVWASYASVLRTLGLREECIAAFRRAVTLSPWNGNAWWSLASLKLIRFTDEEIRTMELQLSRPGLSGDDRANLHYALGKAYDDNKSYQRSFENYLKGNALRRLSMEYDSDITSTQVSKFKALMTPEFLRDRAGSGCESDEPIFVLGMQRAGSTLVEQILGSHSQIEPAGELNDILRLVAEHVMPKTSSTYPDGLEKLDFDELRSLGERYLANTRRHRPLGRPFFVDKCPYNFLHLGLIHLILPNAKIIDIRRHPIGCCYANFTMSFRRGPPVTYRLSEVGRYYVDYVRLMAHFDSVLPGRVHRVIYENLVTNFEAEVRKMLDYLGMPFEEQCLTYYKNDRPLDSYSNEQVRSPIFKDGMERWHNYEPFLGQLKTALGPVLEKYPEVPSFD